MRPTRTKPYIINDCATAGCAEPQGKVIVFDIAKLGGRHMKPHCQLYYIHPGEEINPYQSFYGISLYDGKRVLINSEDVIGVMSPDKLPAYTKLALSKLASPASSEWRRGIKLTMSR